MLWSSVGLCILHGPPRWQTKLVSGAAEALYRKRWRGNWKLSLARLPVIFGSPRKKLGSLFSGHSRNQSGIGLINFSTIGSTWITPKFGFRLPLNALWFRASASDVSRNTTWQIGIPGTIAIGTSPRLVISSVRHPEKPGWMLAAVSIIKPLRPHEDFPPTKPPRPAGNLNHSSVIPKTKQILAERYVMGLC